MILQPEFQDLGFIGNLAITVLSFIPMIKNYKSYKKTGMIDYLLISIYFFTWSVLVGLGMLYYGFSASFITWDGFAGELGIFDWILSKVILHYVDTLDAFPLFIIAIRAKYGGSFKKIPNLIKGLGITSLLLALASYISYWVTNPNELHLPVLILNRVICHAVVVYAFISCKWEETSRSKISRNIWIMGSAIWVLALTLLGTSIYIFPFEYPFLAFILPIDIGFAFLLVNHIFYPEAVLFTHEQIGRALKTYPMLEKSLEDHPDRSIKIIKQYLDSIPEELRVEISNR